MTATADPAAGQPPPAGGGAPPLVGGVDPPLVGGDGPPLAHGDGPPLAPGDQPPLVPGNRPFGRGGWHRSAGLLPVGYLAAIVPVSLVHPFLAEGLWLMLHLLLLGAVTNAIVVWSAHFAAAILRVRTSPGHRGEALRLGVLNAGVLAVLIGGAVGPAWVGVTGSGLVFAAILAHLCVLATWLRRALPARFAVTVHAYLVAAVALLAGIPAGAWMLLLDEAQRPRLLLFHAQVNLLGWVTLTVLGTLLTLWPTVLRTRMVPGATAAATRSLPLGVAGLLCLSAGALAWWPLLVALGLGLFLAAVLVVARPALATARQRPPTTFAAWSIAAGVCWLLVALGWDAVVVLRAPDAASAADGFETVLVPLGVGFAAQVLLGALSYLLPVVLGGGPVAVRARTARLDRHAAQRVTMANLALAVFLLPVPASLRIATSVLVLAAAVQFLVPVLRMLLSRPARAATESRSTPGVAAGAALVLVAVLVGAVGQRFADRDAGATAPVGLAVPTGHTTTVAVSAGGMRYRPDRIEVPAGDRLVIVLTNTDPRRHDLRLTTGAGTAVLAQGESARLDAGIIGATVTGWCSRPGHRQAGMTLTIIPVGSPSTVETQGHPHAGSPRVDAMAEPGHGFVARDASLPPAPPSRLHRITLRAQEVVREVAVGVTQRLWTFDGTAPGPVLHGRVGDTFEITLVNDASVEHGLDFHAEALAPQTAMRTVEPGQSTVYRFTATRAGVWMYHCSAMPMLYHIGNGMYGALVIDPADLAPADRAYVLVQSELYLGAQGGPGDPAKMAAGEPDAVTFNGYVSQYAFRPLTARAGERVRIWVLDAGPGRWTAFHIVGAVFDTVYAEGGYRLRPTDPGGAQVLDLAPAGGGFVETTFGQPGTYPFLSHVMADAERGARGAVQVTP